jgi:uncharacterized protein YndB with AHSA1/START domain
MPANRTYSPDNPVGYEITLTRDNAAPRKLVFAAWTDEEHVKQWWGPAHFDNPVCKVDARVGGLVDIHMRSPDDTVYPMTAIFNEIVPNEKIVFTSQSAATSSSMRGRSMTRLPWRRNARACPSESAWRSGRCWRPAR